MIGLGLSELQARLYLTTLKIGVIKVEVIAELPLVCRQEIHHLIDDLQELGLIQKNLTNPTTLTATPFTEAVTLLLLKKTSQITRQLHQNINLHK